MYRGTTPTIAIKLNTDIKLESLKQIWVTFDNGGGKVITKSIEDVVIDTDSQKLKVSLTQEETLSFTGASIDIQVRILTDTDVALATPIKSLPVSRVLEGGIIE